MGKQNSAKKQKRQKNAIAAAQRTTRTWIKTRQKPEPVDESTSEQGQE